VGVGVGVTVLQLFGVAVAVAVAVSVGVGRFSTPVVGVGVTTLRLIGMVRSSDHSVLAGDMLRTASSDRLINRVETAPTMNKDRSGCARSAQRTKRRACSAAMR
jgi:hypothetical protein